MLSLIYLTSISNLNLEVKNILSPCSLSLEFMYIHIIPSQKIRIKYHYCHSKMYYMYSAVSIIQIDYSTVHVWITGLHVKNLKVLVKLFIQKNCKCILYISNQEVIQNLQMFDYTPDLMFIALRLASIPRRIIHLFRKSSSCIAALHK